MKKLTSILLIGLLSVSLIGCGKEASTTDSDLSAMAPSVEAIDSDAVIETTDSPSGDVYQFIVKNCDRAVYDTYVETCKDGIFTEANCDVENNYQAYNESGSYWVSVSYFPGTEENPESRYMYVDVRKVEKK